MCSREEHRTRRRVLYEKLANIKGRRISDMAQFTEEEFKVVTDTAIEINRVIHRKIIRPSLHGDSHRMANSGGMAMSALAVATASTVIGCGWEDLENVLITMGNHVRFHHRQIREGLKNVKGDEEFLKAVQQRMKEYE